MKRLTCIALILTLTACVPKQELKGTIHIKPFTASVGFLANPVAMNQMAANTVMQTIFNKVQAKLPMNTTLTSGGACPDSDYELTSTLISLDPHAVNGRGKAFLIHIDSQVRIALEMDFVLKSCSGNVLKEFTVKEGEQDAGKLYDTISDRIINRLVTYRLKN
jgi:hypothetical protein